MGAQLSVGRRTFVWLTMFGSLNFPLLIARRYLFARRSTNAIHLITGISVLAVAIGTAALLLVLSVFNGFEDLLKGLFGHFNPDIKITPSRGKTFEADSLLLDRLRATAGVAVLSQTLEEIAFFEYRGAQDFGVLKGVDEQFTAINGIDSTLREGQFRLRMGDRNGAVLGAGMRNKLSVHIDDPLATLTIYMPVRGAVGAMDKPFKTRFAYPTGTFAIQQEYDTEYIISNIAFVRELLDVAPATVSALELRLQPGARSGSVKAAVEAVMGPGFVIRDQYEQNEAFFKVMNLEKWMGFAITSLMLALMAFNLIGALWMIVLDKQKDIAILKGIGASDGAVRRIFMLVGLMLTGLGMAIGLIMAIVLYALQKQYGLVTIPQGFMVTSYPIAMRVSDFIPVVLTVGVIGVLAALLPAQRAVSVPAYLRTD
jgi:lipoprotein-releasing system permease protein